MSLITAKTIRTLRQIDKNKSKHQHILFYFRQVAGKNQMTGRVLAAPGGSCRAFCPETLSHRRGKGVQAAQGQAQGVRFLRLHL